MPGCPTRLRSSRFSQTQASLSITACRFKGNESTNYAEKRLLLSHSSRLETTLHKVRQTSPGVRCPRVMPIRYGDIKIIEKVQRRATELTHLLRGLDYQSRCQHLQLERLEDRIKKLTSCENHLILFILCFKLGGTRARSPLPPFGNID